MPVLDDIRLPYCEGKDFLRNVKPMAEGQLLKERCKQMGRNGAIVSTVQVCLINY